MARRNAGLLAAALVALGGATAYLASGTRELASHVRPTAPAPATDAGASSDEDEDDVLSFRAPSGKPAALTCAQAQQVTQQIRDELLAYRPEPVTPSALASGVEDWLDPYGLWAATPESPVSQEIEGDAPDLVRELEGSEPCAAAARVGVRQVAWVRTLRAELDRGRAAPVDHPRAWATSLAELGPDDAPAEQLARELGERLGATERALGEPGKRYVDDAVARYLPTLSADAWAQITLASTLRAYVPLIDPHGAWAPNGEESSVYDLDLEAHPPERAWTKATRTLLGLRIDDGPLPPLRVGDVVIEVDGIATAGMPPEQLDQLAFAASAPEASLVRIAEGSTSLDRVVMPKDLADAPAQPVATTDLSLDRVRYGSGDVVIVAIPDVPDDLGDRFGKALLEASAGPRPLMGIVIDLRGNGGGSTQGAIDVLGRVLPNAPLFPMKRRDGTIETDRAPASAGVYKGPLATLVDPATASAAEMLAGALGAYHRAPIVGSSTYGKGCAQEYTDDAARVGVLRLTTLLYALPDGSAVQRVGLVPWARIPFEPSDLEPGDREATLPHAPPSWSGPDVRDAELVRRAFVAWPSVSAVGPCKEPRVCEAIATLPGVSARERRVAKH